MGMMKNYLLNLLQQCSEEQFGQDAIEWAIVSGFVKLSYDLDTDIREIMSRYDEIIVAYRRSSPESREIQRAARAPMKRAAPGREAKSTSSERERAA